MPAKCWRWALRHRDIATEMDGVDFPGATLSRKVARDSVVR